PHLHRAAALLRSGRAKLEHRPAQGRRKIDRGLGLEIATAHRTTTPSEHVAEDIAEIARAAVGSEDVLDANPTRHATASASASAFTRVALVRAVLLGIEAVTQTGFAELVVE